MGTGPLQYPYHITRTYCSPACRPPTHLVILVTAVAHMRAGPMVRATVATDLPTAPEVGPPAATRRTAAPSTPRATRIRCVGKTLVDSRHPAEHMTEADCIVAEEMLRHDQYLFLTAKQLEARDEPQDTAANLLQKLVADRIAWTKKTKVSALQLREMQATTVNALKAIAYAQEVSLELDKMILEEVIMGRTLSVPVDIHKILRQLISQETQTSFHGPEIYWIQEDQQPQ